MPRDRRSSVTPAMLYAMRRLRGGAHLTSAEICPPLTDDGRLRGPRERTQVGCNLARALARRGWVRGKTGREQGVWPAGEKPKRVWWLTAVGRTALEQITVDNLLSKETSDGV